MSQARKLDQRTARAGGLPEAFEAPVYERDLDDADVRDMLADDSVGVSLPGHKRERDWFEDAARRGFSDEGSL
jgi:hypothetical protein